jgi:DnaJ-class molecular chaperone
MNTCENCDGTGGWVWIETSLWDDGIRENWDECPACGGSGRVHGDPPQLDRDEAFEP